MNAIAIVKPNDGFEHWHHVTCRSYSLTECARDVDHRFRASIAVRELGNLTVSDVATATPVRATRGPAEIRRDPRDIVMLWVMLEGQIGLTQGDRSMLMKTGDLFAYDQSRPFTLEFTSWSRGLMMTVPRPLLASRLVQANRIGGCHVAGGSGLSALAGSLVSQLYRINDRADERAIPRISTAALDILAAIFDAGTGYGEETTERLDRVKRYILAHLEDPMLDAERIAKAQGMALRTLYRLFADDGSTPMRWLWQQRLARSYKELAEGKAAHVTDAAFGNGFSDTAHFSRAFKATFGQSPRTVKLRRRIR